MPEIRINFKDKLYNYLKQISEEVGTTHTKYLESLVIMDLKQNRKWLNLNKKRK